MSAHHDMYFPLLPDGYYHIYNRGNYNRKIFLKQGNYWYFLRKYKEYLSPYIKTHAYCLIPNHFHFAIQLEPENVVISNFEKTIQHKKHVYQNWYNNDISKIPIPGIDADGVLSDLPGFIHSLANTPLCKLLTQTLASRIVSEQFRKFFLGYAKAINKQEKSTGSLFQKKFRRRLVKSTVEYGNVICYIHRNPIHHQLTNNWENYPWSSYSTIISDKRTWLAKEESIMVFGNTSDFISIHNNYVHDWKETIRWEF